MNNKIIIAAVFASVIAIGGIYANRAISEGSEFIDVSSEQAAKASIMEIAATTDEPQRVAPAFMNLMCEKAPGCFVDGKINMPVFAAMMQEMGMDTFMQTYGQGITPEMVLARVAEIKANDPNQPKP